MFYIIRCPICYESELEKTKCESEKESAEFKCYDCGFDFSADKGVFSEIDDYEVR